MSSLAISSLDDFLFGVAPHPIRLPNGLTVGGGTVYPELNFTLPAMPVEAATLPEVRDQYREMIQGACRRAADLHAPGLVVEFELLPDMTLQPEWGIEIAGILREELNRLQEKHAIPTALRATPNDIREFTRPPMMRSGSHVDAMFASFEGCAVLGADFLSIESTGGKELHDEAILQGDLEMAVFALGVLGCRDMAWLWDRIGAIAQQHGSLPAGDSACGFANTAMTLAEQRFIPRVWAALLRVLSVPRSLVAFQHGAVGPNKDCAYEGPYIKAITGRPISMEGAEAAVAHFSPIGNIARAVTDLWSNESVNNVKLLSGMAPTVSVEQLVYATRLMNTAAAHGPDAVRTLRDWWSESDAPLDPQAYVLHPAVVLALSAEIAAAPTPYLRTRTAAQSAVRALEQAGREGLLTFSTLEQRWLKRLSAQAADLPEDENELFRRVEARIPAGRVRLEEYGL